MEAIYIDGSSGEGGGQVLRSALTLSILTGQAVIIDHIRAQRSKPGLQAQHLKSVDAAATVSRAVVHGAAQGSAYLQFTPGEIRSGRFRVDIGTAGAAPLVLQTIFIPLSMANAASSVMITGGTHVPWAPCFHYLEMHWLPMMRQIGFDAQISLDQAGYYPRGGGKLNATIRTSGEIFPVRLTQRGELVRIEGISGVSNLDFSIADRQKRQALRRLEGTTSNVKIKTAQLPSIGKGTFLLLLAHFAGGQCCYFALGELGKPAERVADEAVDALLEFLSTDGTVDQYLADQLLLPLSFANAHSEFRTSKITSHLLTNASIIRQLTSAQVEISGNFGEAGLVRVTPQPQAVTQPGKAREN